MPTLLGMPQPLRGLRQFLKESPSTDEIGFLRNTGMAVERFTLEACRSTASGIVRHCQANGH